MQTHTTAERIPDRSSYLAVLRRIDFAHPSPRDLALWAVGTARREGRMLGDSDGECLDLAESMLRAALDYSAETMMRGRPVLSTHDQIVVRAAWVRVQRWICAYAAIRTA